MMFEHIKILILKTNSIHFKVSYQVKDEDPSQSRLKAAPTSCLRHWLRPRGSGFPAAIQRA